MLSKDFVPLGSSQSTVETLMNLKHSSKAARSVLYEKHQALQVLREKWVSLALKYQ